MDIGDVPQEDNTTLDGHSKSVYARSPKGRLELVSCRGWSAEEIVTLQAVETFNELVATARERVHAGLCSPLEYHMYRVRMDLPMLAQVSGVWRWRVRRHLRPAPFGKLSSALRARYAEALGMEPAQLDSVD